MTPLTTSNLSGYDVLYSQYLQSIRSGAFAQAGQLINEAVKNGLNPVAIYDQVFAPSLREVGKLWETGELTVAQEHLATGITEYCRTLLSRLPDISTNNKGWRVLLTNVSGNQHTLGINLLCDTFRWHGWQIFPLITALPESQIAEAASIYQVDLVCLSVALPAQINRAISTIKTLRASNWKGLIEVGGPAFVGNTEAAKLTGADFLGNGAEATVETATSLLKKRK